MCGEVGFATNLAMLTLLCVIAALPDPTALRPERMLGQTELTVDVGLSGYASATTRTPTGALERDHYETITTRIRGEVGITRYMKFELLLPLVDYLRDSTYQLQITRFGDPMIGLAAGGPLARTGAAADVTVAAFAELTFPTMTKVTLSPIDTSLRFATHGVVVTTGGVAASFGAFLGYRLERDRLGVELSGRGLFRVRSNDASNGAGFDVRAQLRVFTSLLLGVRVDGLFAFGGLEQALISASRLSDGASWVDVSVLLGWRFFKGLDLVAAFTAPAYVQSTSFGMQGQALLSYTYIPK